MTNKYYPEGMLIGTNENKAAMRNIFFLTEAMYNRQILEARVEICDNEHNMLVDLQGVRGIIPRNEGAIGIAEGKTRDISLISRVNKPVCFIIKDIRRDNSGNDIAILSRREVQEQCEKNFLSKLSSGDIIRAKVTHLEPFGCFVDIGCGIPSLIPIDAISVSRISHPSDRFYLGQDIFVAIKGRENEKILLTHKELLGTWEENVRKFECGQTVAGIVRSVESYGIFIELAPNLAGLAEYRDGVSVGQYASVYIKAIIPDKMKVKLIIVDIFDAEKTPSEIRYFISEGHIDSWKYSSENSRKSIETIF